MASSMPASMGVVGAGLKAASGALRALSDASTPGSNLWAVTAVKHLAGISSSPTTAPPPPEPLYPTHVRLSGAQRASVAVLSAFGALARPQRADLVAALGETTGTSALLFMRQQMEHTSEGREVLRLRPRVTNKLFEDAVRCPPGSFGRAYADFMDRRRFQADERPPVRFVDDPELAYIVTRAREVHDFWHVLFDCHTNVFGELVLKALEAVQTGLPMAVLSVAGGHLRLPRQQRTLLAQTYLPWALRAGSQCEPLMAIHYEAHFQEDLKELRRRWKIAAAPKTDAMKGV